MDLVTSEVKNDILIISLHGRVDSANAADCEAQVTAARESAAAGSVELDCDDLDYISSAGLRVILRLRKAVPDLKVTNVNSTVYEILETTGFTEMMTVTKGYRRVSVEGCEVIGKGANGEVYRIDPDTIVKVYLNPDSLPDIHRERELARRALVLGVPTAIPYDVVKVGNGYGSVFELLNARSFAKIIKAEPERLDEVIGMSVDLLKLIHGTEVEPEDMPDMRAVAIDWVEFLKPYLPEATWTKLMKLISDIPVKHNMLHGDYHVKNVMVQNGEVLLIDMDTLSQGAPIFEFASVFNAYIGFSAIDPTTSEKFLGIPTAAAQKFWRDTVSLYFGNDSDEFFMNVQNKASLVGYARILRRFIRRNDITTGEGKEAFELYRNKVIDLVDRVDTLDLYK